MFSINLCYLDVEEVQRVLEITHKHHLLLCRMSSVLNS